MEDTEDSPIHATPDSFLLPPQETKASDQFSSTSPRKDSHENRFSDHFKGSLIHAHEGVFEVSFLLCLTHKSCQKANV